MTLGRDRRAIKALAPLLLREAVDVVGCLWTANGALFQPLAVPLFLHSLCHCSQAR